MSHGEDASVFVAILVMPPEGTLAMLTKEKGVVLVLKGTPMFFFSVTCLIKDSDSCSWMGNGKWKNT